MTGTMEKRCQRCRDGLVTLFGAGGRKVVTCTCARGQARDAAAVAPEAPVAQPVQQDPDADLKARLLSAFHSIVKS